MADSNKFTDTVSSLFEGMENIVSSKTVVGDAIHVGDTIILPLVDVSFGIGAGAFSNDKNTAAGLGGKVSPNALLVISNGTTKVVNIKDNNHINKVIDMVPDLINKFMPGSKDPLEGVDIASAEEEAKKQADRKNKKNK